MGTIAYNGDTVVYSGVPKPSSSDIAVTLGTKGYATAAALIAGESLTTGNVFYITDSGDTLNAALLAAKASILGSYVSYAIMPFDSFYVASSSTITYYTLTEMGIDATTFLAEFAAIDANVLAATNGSIIERGSAWGVYAASKIQQDPATGKITDGIFVNAATGSGNVVSSTMTTAFGIYADDGGAAFAASGSDMRTLRARLLITHAQSGVNNYFSGFLGHLKYTAVADTCTASFRGGVRGYLESISGSTIGDASAGVIGLVDAPSGATIGTGYVSAFLASSVNLGGTHTGKAVALDVRKPQTAGVFDALMHIDTTSGVVNTVATGSQDTSKWLVVYWNDTQMKIPLYAIS